MTKTHPTFHVLRKARAARAPLARTLAALVALSLTLSLMPMSAFAEELDATPVPANPAATELVADPDADPVAADDSDITDGDSDPDDPVEAAPAGDTSEGVLLAASADPDPDPDASDTPLVAAADVTTVNISKLSELQSAFYQANNTPGDYVWNITSSFYDNNELGANLVLNNVGSTVTILGNNHTITFQSGFSIVVKAGTLNLGSPEGTSTGGTVTLVSATRRYGSLIELSGENAVLNLYDGGTIGGINTSSGYGTYGSYGIAVAVVQGSFNMYGGTIKNCKNSNFGGAVCVGTIGDRQIGSGGGDASFTMSGGEITNNTCLSANDSMQMGGGVCVGENGSFSMTGGTISNNTAAYGGGVYVATGSVSLTGGTISGNTGTYGGGLYHEGNTAVTLAGTTITGNTGTYGGGVYLSSGNKLNHSAGTITKNTATQGGGVYCHSDAWYTMSGSAQLHNNTASTAGADLYAQDYPVVTLVDATGMGATLESSGKAINGWFYDGLKDGTTTTSRWGYNSSTGVYSYVEKPTTSSGAPLLTHARGVALIAAHDATTTTTYTVSYVYDNDAPDGAPAVPASSSVAPGTVVTIASRPQVDGWIFDGWRTGDAPDHNNTITMPSKNVTFHGKWFRDTTRYTVTYSYTGTVPSGAPSLPTNASYTYGTTVDVADLPEVAGYTFSGWTSEQVTPRAKNGSLSGASLSAAGGSALVAASVASGLVFDMPQRNVSFVGSFTPVEYAIAYDLGGGAVAGTNPAAYTVESDTITLINPTRPGYVFAGWTGTGLDGATMTVTIPRGSTGDRAYAATWTPAAPGEHTITFDTRGGSAVAPITQRAGTPVTAPADPTRLGYTFVGWDREIPATMPDEDLTISATWTPVEYAIAYDLGGGAVAGTNPATYTVESDTITLINPTRPGYVFAGWTGTGLDGATMTVTIPKGSTGDRAYAATWTPAAPGEHTITFDTRGGSAVAPITQQAGTPVTAPADPTRPGYVFDGWDVPVPATMPDHDMTITAKWKPATPTPGPETHTVTFDTRGGSPVAPGTAEHGRPVARPADPTRDGFDFAGWYADAALTVLWDFSRPVTGDMTLHAAWTPRATPARTAAGETLVPRAQATSARQAQGSPAALPRTGEDALPVAFVVVVGLAATALGAWLALRRREG